MRTVVLLALLAAAPPALAGASPAPTVHDAYAPALAEARARGVPLLVDVWAPW
ncbi:MAG TPA: hypothetical protein VFM45_01060 [Anaeromyxobacteraceae bacterium]|nr:hypothetical protein [Anaeromyxobacteraceae bacterium]